MFLSSANFFINVFKKSFGLDTGQDQHSAVLLWIQTVCKGFQQTTKLSLLVVKQELKLNSIEKNVIGI